MPKCTVNANYAKKCKCKLYYSIPDPTLCIN